MRFKSDTEALVLGALSEGPLHGYAIVKTIRDNSGGMFNLPESQLYPLLHKMQAEEWIKGEWLTSESGPARKAYTLSEAGRTELARRQKDFAKFTSAVGALLLPKEPCRE